MTDQPQPHSPSSTSRRESLGTAGAGPASAVAAPAATETGQQAPSTAPAAERAAVYPTPPFQEQSQPWPGLWTQMLPRPDHGETSYCGSGRLAGRRALITGGDSGIGAAAAIAFAREGADVVIAHLPQEQPDADEIVKLIRADGQGAFADRRYPH
jgi:hypothetical protein